MPYFEDINFLFIHIPKTGGSNIENFFFQYLNIKPTINNILSNNMNLKINNHSLQHMTFKEFYDFKDFFKINFNNIKILSVVRNPYDRIISDIFYLKFASINNSTIEIENIIEKYLNSNHLYDNHKLEQYKFLIDDNDKINNDIIIFKSESLNKQMEDLGFPEFKTFCNFNYSNKNYMKYLTNKSIKMINNYYYKDFLYFNYNML